MTDRTAPHELHVRARRFKLLPWPRRSFAFKKDCSCREAELVADELRSRRARVAIVCRAGHDQPAERRRSRWRSRRGTIVTVMSKSEAKRTAYPARARAAGRRHGRAGR